MAAKKPSGPMPLNGKQFANGLAARLGVSPAEAVRISKAFQDEVVDCLVNGYKITFPGFGRFVPQYVPEKKASDLVRNPSTGEVGKRGKNVPATFKAKAFVSSSVGKLFPTTRTQAGKALADLLAPPPPKVSKGK